MGRILDSYKTYKEETTAEERRNRFMSTVENSKGGMDVSVFPHVSIDLLKIQKNDKKS